MISMNRVVTISLVAILALASASVPSAWCQGADAQGELLSQGPKRHISTIVFAGLAGAIMGLSTLSFYGRPQDKLNNIAMGFAVGVIGGAMFTTYKAATEPKDFYGMDRHDRSAAPLAWQEPVTPEEAQLEEPRVSYSFTF